MLVLTRKVWQSVVVRDRDGHELKVTVNEVHRGRVKLCFDGPQQHFMVEREERTAREEDED